MLIDLVIPAFNEAENLPALLAELPSGAFRHVVVCDNGSTDETAEKAREGGAEVVSEPSRGYGSACLAGLAWIGKLDQPPDAVAFLDADLADDPALLPQLIKPVADDVADLVIGSRVKHAQPGALTLPQRFGNWLSTRLIRACTGERFTDLGPMRVIRWSSLQQIEMADKTWGWTVEMQYKAGAEKLRCVEIDVPYRPRRAGKSKISGSIKGSVKAGTKILSTIAALRLGYRPGRR